MMLNESGKEDDADDPSGLETRSFDQPRLDRRCDYPRTVCAVIAENPDLANARVETLAAPEWKRIVAALAAERDALKAEVARLRRMNNEPPMR